MEECGSVEIAGTLEQVSRLISEDIDEWEAEVTHDLSRCLGISGVVQRCDGFD